MTTLRKTIIVGIFGLLCSCSFNKKPHENDNSKSYEKLDTIVPFSGFWLNENYIETVLRTRSPRQSQNENANSIIIPKRTLEVTSIFGALHDGAADMIVVKKPDKYQFYYKYDDTIWDVAYDIKLISKEKIKIGRDTYKKATENFFLEDLLFKGHYSSDKGANIEFTGNGKVKGLDNYKSYGVVSDYIDEGSDVDQVFLWNDDKHRDEFGFKFVGDSLFIYKIKCLEYDSVAKMCAKVDFGQLTYKLRKK